MDIRTLQGQCLLVMDHEVSGRYSIHEKMLKSSNHFIYTNDDNDELWIEY